MSQIKDVTDWVFILFSDWSNLSHVLEYWAVIGGNTEDDEMSDEDNDDIVGEEEVSPRYTDLVYQHKIWKFRNT